MSSAPVRFSVGLPQNLTGDDTRPVAAYAARAEALGFYGLWTLDSALGGPTAHTPLLDGLQVLSHVAAVTERPRLGIAVIVMGRRQPALLARELATVDRLSGGRLVVGVGLGAPEGERVAALGFPTDRRVRRLTEGVAVMRALWAGDEAGHDGELWRFSGARGEPQPPQRPRPPLWVGARPGPARPPPARPGGRRVRAGPAAGRGFCRP